MAVMTAMLVGIAGYLGGTGWMIGAFVFAGLLNFGSYWFSDRMVLKMYDAQKISREDAPRLYHLVDRLRRVAGLPMPTVAIAPTSQPNAFATGRNPENAVICVTEGLLNLLGDEEMAGVVAHELAHIQNRDMLIGTMAATLAGAIVMLARLGFWFGGRDRGGLVGALLMIIVAPIAAMLVRMAISRAGEYRADQHAAQITRNPRGLARALQRIEAGVEQHGTMKLRGRMGAHTPNEATTHLCIANPFRKGGNVSFAHLFSTHPPMEDRVQRLQEMENQV